MRAIRVYEFGEPDVMKLEELPDPQPGVGRVLVRVHAAGVNPLDTYIRGQVPGTSAPTPPLPYTPGFDAAGVVEAIGEGVSKVKVGDRVYAQSMTGTYAELALCDEASVHPLPDKISYAQGAAIPSPYPSAHYSLFGLAKAAAGETVFVHGASGSVGVAAVQLARAAGLTVVGTAGSERGLQLVQEQGAHYILNHRESDYLDKALAITGGNGFDIILEMNATLKLAQDVKLFAMGARLIIIGGTKGEVTFDPAPILWKGASVIGLNIFAPSPKEISSIHAALFAGLENGTLRPIVGQEMPLSDAPKAHVAVEESGSFGKIVLIP